MYKTDHYSLHSPIVITLSSCRNMTVVAEGMLVLGKPYSAPLSASQQELFLKAGIIPPITHPLLVYSKLLIRDSNRIISNDSKQTLRNNSCLKYQGSSGQDCFGLLRHVLVHEQEAFVVIVSLKPTGMKLCSDDITHAQIDCHLVACFSPRYII